MESKSLTVCCVSYLDGPVELVDLQRAIWGLLSDSGLPHDSVVVENPRIAEQYGTFCVFGELIFSESSERLYDLFANNEVELLRRHEPDMAPVLKNTEPDSGDCVIVTQDMSPTLDTTPRMLDEMDEDPRFGGE